MPDTKKTPSTADIIWTGAVVAVVCFLAAFLAAILAAHYLFGETWRFAAIHGVSGAITATTIVTFLSVWRRRAR